LATNNATFKTKDVIQLLHRFSLLTAEDWASWYLFAGRSYCNRILLTLIVLMWRIGWAHINARK